VKRLNLGCGRNPLEGWINLDSARLPGIDVVADLERCANTPLPFDDDSIDEFLMSHVLEHIRAPLPLMQELWRIAKPTGRLTIRAPYGHSDDAWTDPTHVRPYFIHSFGFFSQPLYWRADYGYRGDWKTNRIVLFLDPRERNTPPQQVMDKVMSLRNVVKEMVAELTAVKPARPPELSLQDPINVELAFTS
jgi:SAM-dependent methyltransferase